MMDGDRADEWRGEHYELAHRGFHHPLFRGIITS